VTDLELIKLAAKAAGYEVDQYGYRTDVRDNGGGPMDWNPLESSEDALSLAAELKITLVYGDDSSREMISAYAFHFEHIKCYEPVNGNPQHAYRRAIVRIAAEIGRG
jgi:hypothetical protein